jgi:predicted transcriptional regulator
VNATGWSRGLEVTGGGTGVVSHAGLVLLRQLADRTGLTAGLSAALPSPDGGHDRGRVFADLACAIADGARAFSDFRVMGDQQEVFGQVASVPTAWRALKEIAGGGDRTRRRITAAVNKTRRHAWSCGIARHGQLPPVRVADRQLAGITCIRLDATVVPAHSDKEQAEPNFKGYGHHPLLAACDNTREPLAWMLRPGSAGSNTAADHLQVLQDAIAALPPELRRKLMVTCDGAGASHDLVKKLDKLASRRGYQLIYSVGWALGEREKAALALVPETAWEAAIDAGGKVRERRSDDACGNERCAHQACWIGEAHVTELTGLLRHGPDGDRLKAWPKKMRVFARRERPHPGAQLTLFEAANGWRYSLWATNLPAATRGWRGQCACIDAAHRVHARVEDVIRTGKATGLGRFPSRDYQVNKAWLDASMTACILLSWLRLLALDGTLAKAEPKTLRYRLLRAAARLVRGGRRRTLKIAAAWPWATAITTAWQRIQALPHPT